MTRLSTGELPIGQRRNRCEFYPIAFSLGRHVILPKELAKTLPKARLLSEQEWRGIGVQQSRGWGHYAIHRWANLRLLKWEKDVQSVVFLRLKIMHYRPEPHILLFRRPLGTDPVTGKVDSELERQAKDEYLQTLASTRAWEGARESRNNRSRARAESLRSALIGSTVRSMTKPLPSIMKYLK